MGIEAIDHLKFVGPENGTKEDLTILYQILRQNAETIEALSEIGYPALSKRGKYSFTFLERACIVTYRGPGKHRKKGHIRLFGYGNNKDALEKEMKERAVSAGDQFLIVVPYPLFSMEEMPTKFDDYIIKEEDPNPVYRLAMRRSDFEQSEEMYGEAADDELTKLEQDKFEIIPVQTEISNKVTQFADTNYPNNIFDPYNVTAYDLHFAFIDSKGEIASLSGIGGRRKVEIEGINHELFLLLDGITRADVRNKHLVSHLVRHIAQIIFAMSPNAVIIVDANNKSLSLLTRAGFKHISTFLWCDYKKIK